MNLFIQITDYDNIRKAYLKARKGKAKKNSIKKFQKNISQNLNKIKERLEPNPNFGTYKQFEIYDPKYRIITATTFEERIMQHAIMNVLESIFERHFIFHTYACRKNKGSHLAIRTLQKKCMTAKYFIKLDVKKYFDNINHSILKTKLLKLIKETRTLFLLNEIIDSYSLCDEEPVGLPIGNLTSQFFANFFLSELDHFVIEKLKPLFFCRYMDDMILLCNSKKQSKELFVQIDNFCTQKLKLTLKPMILGKIENGIPFLGYRIYKNKITPLAKKKTSKFSFSFPAKISEKSFSLIFPE